MNIRKIVVPHLGRKQYKKNYITKRVPPPSLWQNKWYFQQDMCNLPLFILKTCAVSLDQFYQPDTQLSNNITLVTLNTDMFQNPNWHWEGTTGYIPKSALKPNEGYQPVYIYGNERGLINISNSNQLVKLADTIHLKPGNTIGTTASNPQNDWGNPFDPKWLSPEVTLFYSFENLTAAKANPPVSQFYYTFEKCRYNPIKDTGEGNKVYFKSTKLNQGTFLTLPKEDIIITEYPLWLVFWAWTDWIEKSKPIQHIKEDYQIVVQSNFIQPKRNSYVFVDKYLWGADRTHQEFTETDKGNWHPKYGFQTEVEDQIASNPQNDWGNPFDPKWLSPEVTLFYSFENLTAAKANPPVSQFYYTFEKCRYNPIKDTGEGNKVYFKSNKTKPRNIYLHYLKKT